jgi:adsorption protein B
MLEWVDGWIAALLVPLACWVLLSGLDDLFVTAVFLLRRRRTAEWPGEAELRAAPRARIAILVPLWREHEVIERMLEHNLAAIEYDNYDIFAGVYANDPATRRAVEAVAARAPNVHLAACPQSGPTSKADCLNAVYRAMQQWEREWGARFDIVVTHDAEDLIHPRSLAVIDHFAQQYDMVQIPVLPLPTPAWRLVHGLYCDEFAEYQTKDVPVRGLLGGFLPSNGVGTGFTRGVLERLARARGGAVFEPHCLTEDYENGWAVHALGCPQVFVPLTRVDGRFAATREYFPSTFRAAMRQRKRWVTGIALQGWEEHGWEPRLPQAYWFWRDRKGLLGNLLAPPANLIFLYGAARWALSGWFGGAWGPARLAPEWFGAVWAPLLAIAVTQVGMRMACAARVYGLAFAALSPVRAVLGNWLNCAATAWALGDYALARRRCARLAWGKTDHRYPEGEALQRHKPRLGEILVRLRCLPARELDEAVQKCPPGLRIGEYLVQMQKINERGLYQALSLQSGLPLEDAPPVSGRAARILPARLQRRLRVLPVKVEEGKIFVAVTEPPGRAVAAALHRCCTLEIRYCLMPPTQMGRLLHLSRRAG